MHGPAFRQDPLIRVLGADLVALLYETDEVVLEGRLYALIAPLIDGCRDADQIAGALRGRASVLDVRFGLSLLESQGLLAPAAQHTAARHAPRRGRAASGAPPLDVDIVITDDYANERLASINRGYLRSGRRWMLVKPLGELVWVGPLFVPGETACWTCLARRLSHNRPVASHVAATAISAHMPRRTESVEALLASPALVAEVRHRIRALAGPSPAHTLCTIDPQTLAIVEHHVLRLPDCPACGHAARTRRRRVTLVSRQAIVTGDGGTAARRLTRRGGSMRITSAPSPDSSPRSARWREIAKE